MILGVRFDGYNPGGLNGNVKMTCWVWVWGYGSAWDFGIWDTGSGVYTRWVEGSR